MKLSRRDVLRTGIASAAGLACPSFARAESARPSYVVLIFLTGGYDSVLTVDPKEQASVEPNISCGYRPDDRIRGKKRLFGPLMGGLAELDEDLCIVHGVRTDTVSHSFGQAAFQRGRLAFSPSAPLIGDAIGSELPGTAPIPHLHTSVAISPMPKGPMTVVDLPAAVSQAIFQAVEAPSYRRRRFSEIIEATRLEDAGAVFDDEAAAEGYRASARRAAGLGDLLARARRLEGFSDPQFGHRLQLAFNAIKLDRARCITVGAQLGWFDSHVDNYAFQKVRAVPAFKDIARFVALLKEEKNAYGSLFEQTTIVMGSELGRFPRLNISEGKDHWPENSWMLLGRGIRGGTTVAATDPRFKGLPVDYVTGSTASANARPIFLNSIFATILKLAGANPATHGFSKDEVLDCLLG